MIVIHLNNGSAVEMLEACFQVSGEHGMLYYESKEKNKWIGSLTKNGEFIDAGTSTVRIIKDRTFTAMEIIARLKDKEAFSHRENSLLGDLKRLLRDYKPSSNKYIK